MMETPSAFYVTGGTLRYDAPSYVARRADDELYDGLHGLGSAPQPLLGGYEMLCDTSNGTPALLHRPPFSIQTI